MKVYHRGQAGETRPRQQAGGRSPDAADFPDGTGTYANRDIERLAGQAAARGTSIGIYTERILDSPMPRTRTRTVYALIGLARKYGNGPVEQACAAALELDVISVVEPPVGIEPTTCSLRVNRSAD